MHGKGAGHANEEANNKKKRKVIPLSEKVEVLSKLNSGMSTAVVRCHYSVNKLMICFIKKKKIRSQKAFTPVNCKNYLYMLL
jgi:hypothetical protein